MRHIMGASHTVSDHWGLRTERSTSKWSTVCLMYMDFGSTLRVLPHWLDCTSAMYRTGKHECTRVCNTSCWHNHEGGHVATEELHVQTPCG